MNDKKKNWKKYIQNIQIRIFTNIFQKKKNEPRLGPKIRSSLVTKISSGVEPYKLTLALGTYLKKMELRY